MAAMSPRKPAARGKKGTSDLYKAAKELTAKADKSTSRPKDPKARGKKTVIPG